MEIELKWWENDKNLKPNYDRKHTHSVFGKTAKECMAQIFDMRMNHDVAKYTPIEIVAVYD